MLIFFRWKYDEPSDTWTGIIRDCVYRLKQNEDGLFYSVIGSLTNPENGKKNVKDGDFKCSENDFESILKSYFRLDIDLDSLYRQWSDQDEMFKIAAEKFYGIRILAQEPVENLFSFICSQNNHISR